MRYFLDTEYIETERAVDLVSIGVVAEDGRELYAISTEFDPAPANDFVRTVVFPALEPRDHPAWMTRDAIRRRLRDFVADDIPSFCCWGGAAYDWWATVQLFPLPERVPDGWKYSAYDVMQLAEQAGMATDPIDPQLPAPPPDAHHALVDARWTRRVYDVLAR